MNISSIKASLLKKLQNRRYRRAFADSHVGNRIAMQLRALRRSRENLSQDKLAKEIGMAQPRLSVMENPDYQNYSIKTLKRIAAYYDVILDVRFISFRKFLDEILTQRPEDLAPPSFGEAFATANANMLLWGPSGQTMIAKQQDDSVKDMLHQLRREEKLDEETQGLTDLRSTHGSLYRN